MENECRLRAGLRRICIQDVGGSLRIELNEPETDEAVIPRVEAVPVAARCVMTDVLALHVLREDNVAQRYVRQQLLAEPIWLPGGRGERTDGLQPGSCVQRFVGTGVRIKRPQPLGLPRFFDPVQTIAVNERSSNWHRSQETLKRH